jgi:rubrerythrin
LFARAILGLKKPGEKKENAGVLYLLRRNNKMVKLYICKICGEPYIGGSEPDDCPFCGAPKSYMRPVEEFSMLWDAKLTEQEKKDIQATLNLEVNATAYYNDVTKSCQKYSKYNRLYKQLARVEQEHADIACKFLGKELPGLKGEKSKGTIEKDLERTKELEHHAVELYTNFLKNAENVKVRMFFSALIHAEKGHEEIVGKEIE